MTTITRTDCHRPSAIEPYDYEFVCFEHIKMDGFADCQFIIKQREILRKHMSRTGGNYSAHDHGGNCGICGSVNAQYTIQFYHAKTNSYVRVGQDCAEKLSFGYGDFNAFRRDFKEAQNFKAGKAKALDTLKRIDMSEAWDIAFNDDHLKPTRMPFEESTIRDLVDKLITYGSLSEKQMLFMGNLLRQIKQRPAIQAKRQEEAENAADCPTGRAVIKGTVLCVKTQESDFGIQTKVLVRANEGFKVWGSRFANCGKGDIVEFKGTLERSEKDAKFGFFKRPQAIKVVSEEGEVLFPEQV